MKSFAVWLIVSFLSLGVGSALAEQSFSCPWGKNAACLDYGDKVCSQMGKCVDDDAVCFNRYTCNFSGFMCVSDHEDYVAKAKEMAGNYDDFRRCISRASDMDEVQSCLRKDRYR